MATNTTRSAAADGIRIFNGLKLDPGGGDGTVSETGTLTGSRRGAGGGSSRTRTTVISSASSRIRAASLVSIASTGAVTGAIRWIVIPAAIVKSSINSATV